MNPNFHIPYAVPTVLLATALLFKLPTIVRAWRDPDVRATTLLLTWATAVLVVITPANIERLNVLTGIPNIASPWAYSFLTAFCATGLTMIMRWREEPSPQRQRRMRRVYWIYSGIIVALWVTFLVAHVPTPRIYDLDTYYASTPWMREHILLYLLAHMVSSLVAAYMLWTWSPEITNAWLKTGVICLQLGFASGLIFDIAKLAALGARWSGTNWDNLSTQAAPPFALLEAILVAIGFIVPQAGPFLQKRLRDQSDYWRLYRLWRLVRILAPASAKARFGLWAPLDLRLMQRRQRVHDALRLLAPYLDYSLYQRAEKAASAALNEEQARALAGAVTIRAAIRTYHGNAAGGDATARPDSPTPSPFGSEIHDHIDAISDALRHPRVVDSFHKRMTRTESTDAHA
ncbi:MAB_1171c family putative transporter [Streptomyces alanosinicus]|uniref:DUF6545 domain-containing protein n=1 Tax=Streptomyces alanosinicus TaxID=68171 RepID=A0A918YSQ6_9ACTN|nr:MAB_1171c family putative transporter [Streptomyces alanosinicus]GHE14752.1 hypothetical protein GCM10010339_86870 [Streptomyces alanosinicus]